MGFKEKIIMKLKQKEASTDHPRKSIGQITIQEKGRLWFPLPFMLIYTFKKILNRSILIRNFDLPNQ
jgi:hypothetical protein